MYERRTPAQQSRRKGGRMLARTPHLFQVSRVSLQVCSRVSTCINARTIAYTRSKKFPMEGSYYNPVLRQHELLEEHMSPKYYPGDNVLDEEFRNCEDSNKPFLLNGRVDLLTTYQDSRPKKWIEGVVPARGTFYFLALLSIILFIYFQQHPTNTFYTRWNECCSFPSHPWSWM